MRPAAQRKDASIRFAVPAGSSAAPHGAKIERLGRFLPVSPANHHLNPEDAMPRGWSKHDETMYEAIKESSLDRGMDEGRAQEIAARTVNKNRRLEGRSANKNTQGTGNPHSGYEDRTRDELYNIAKKKNIPGRSKMDKQQLVAALRET
jgi:hypothetical protein